MEIFNIVVIAFIILFFSIQALAWIKARKMVGQTAPDTSTIDGGVAQADRRLYYFYSQHFGPCKSVTPVVEKIKLTHHNVIQVDVEKSLELCRSFSVAGTPSFVLVEGARVKRVLIGGQSEKRLLGLIEGIPS